MIGYCMVYEAVVQPSINKIKRSGVIIRRA